MRDHYRTYDGGTRWGWRTWPLEFWEDIHFYARSESRGDEAVFLRVLRTLRREPWAGPSACGA